MNTGFEIKSSLKGNRMTDTLKQRQQITFDEMMSHPVLFLHPRAHQLAIVGEYSAGILQEVLKHDSEHHRLTVVAPTEWKPQSLDVIILATEKAPLPLEQYHSFLKNDGILVQLSGSLFDIDQLKIQYQALKKSGFYDIQLCSFPQPDYFTGWRTALIAIKNTPFKRIREKDIFNRTFKTNYYNFDVHKASLVLPEFMREALTI